MRHFQLVVAVACFFLPVLVSKVDTFASLSWGKCLHGGYFICTLSETRLIMRLIISLQFVFKEYMNITDCLDGGGQLTNIQYPAFFFDTK